MAFQMNKKNCAECTRWRPLTDYGVAKWWPNKTRVMYLDSYCKPCRRIMNRARYLRLNSAQAQQRRENARMIATARRRDKGVPVRGPYKLKGKSYKDSAQLGRRLPAAPMLAILNASHMSNVDIADAVGVDEALIRRLREGSKTFITESTADRILSYFGTPLALVYPEH